MNKKNTAIGAISIFIIFFSLFFFLHSRINGLFTIDDPYYHAKHAYLMAETGNYTLVKPWLEFHFFKYAPVDAWWGYHVILALFIKFFGLLFGAKILASALSALAFSTFYLILKSFKIKYAAAITFIYYASSYFFQFRLLSERPYISAFTVLPLGFWLISRRKFIWLFVLSAAYTVFYQLSPLIVVLAGAYVLADLYLTKKINLKPVIFTAGGVITGILIHPKALNYIYVMFVHLFQVLYLKFSGMDLNVGAELHTGNFLNFVNQNAIGLFLYLFSVAIFFGLPKTDRRIKNLDIYFLLFYSLAWFIFGLIVPRGLDYWYSFAWLFIIFVLNYFLATADWPRIKELISSRVNTKILVFFICAIVLSFFLYNFTNLYGQVLQRSQETIDADFQEANNWLLRNTPADSIVFYANWSIWPMMFYYNDHNHYIAGMDPTLLYDYDKKVYWLWRNIGSGAEYCDQKTCPSLAPARNISQIKHAFREIFRSNFIIMDNNDKWPLKNMLSADHRDYRTVFANKKLVIYRVLW
jgi:hypothetical protein